MNFELTETQTLVRDTARDLARRIIAPQAVAADRDETLDRSMLKAMAQAGLMSVNIPDALGGAEAGVVAYSLAMTEVASACASTAVTMAVSNMAGEVIAQFGTATQKEEHVRKIASGEHVAGAFALSEAEAGSDPGGMRTTAVKDGDHWVINGSKQWITSGEFAGVFIVWARTGAAGSGARGLSCFLVPAGSDGFAVGRREEKMGLKGSPTNSLSFTNCRVPSTALLGELGGGFKVAMMALDGGRIGIASQALGIAEGALAEAIQYSKDRAQFGKPISDFQAIQWMIADSRKELDASRLLIMRAASMKERGVPFSREASMAKLYTTEAAWRVCNRAIQILGGYGYTREFSVERRFRDVRVTQIYEGTSEVQRIVIARSVLNA